ncbi:ABC transporter permease [Cryobacterium arcticum]|uniref:ABC transporter permease n=1 Tax=Cryobacterium arcticum TaxID=670052 RepID=A0A318A7F7_9MICO|nr:ABC transporter permease subunit [Cryobacterium arcticum]PXA73230.1 ABC transporter permease [Cryobacterium arcticum]
MMTSTLTAARRRAERRADGASTSAPTTPDRSRRSFRRNAPLGWILPVAIIVIWYILYETGVINPTLFSSPVQVIEALIESMLTGAFWENFLASATRWIVGFLIGASLGLVLGSITGLSRLSERLLDTTFQMLRTVPFMGLVPLFVIWFGLGEMPKIILISFAAFFPVYLATYAGIRDIDRKLIEVGRVYELSTFRTVKDIVMPGALPSILQGIRLALGVAWLALVIAELNGANSGIGYWMQQGREFVRVDIVIAALLVFAVVGKLVDMFVRMLEQRLLGWRDNLAKEM